MRSTAPTGAPSRVRPCAGRASTSRSRPVNPDTRTAGERWGAARRTPATSPSVRSPTVIYYSEYAGVRTEEKFASRPGLFCGLVMLFDVQNAEPLAMINEGYLQHFRVGADAGIGTRYMAREDAHVVGMFGSGGMARSHVAALRCVRPIDRIQVFSPTREHREAYAQEMAELYDVEAVAVDDPGDVCRGADIVCECTDAAQPVVMGRWLEPGMHRTAIGNHYAPQVYERVDLSFRLGTAPTPIGLPQWATEQGSVTYAAGATDIGETTKAHRSDGRFQRVVSSRACSQVASRAGPAPARSPTPPAGTCRARSSLQLLELSTRPRGQPAWAVSCRRNGSFRTSATERPRSTGGCWPG